MLPTPAEVDCPFVGEHVEWRSGRNFTPSRTRGFRMTDLDRAEQYRLAETLIGEQNFTNGLAAAVVAAIAGAFGWGVVSMATGYMVGWVAIGLGVLVGYGMQVFGRGLTAKFSAAAAALAVFGCLAGNLAGAILYDARTYGLSARDIFSGMTLDDVVAFYSGTLTFMDLVFWLLAVGAAWQFAPRRLSVDEEIAIRRYEERPDAGQGMIS